jgi:hypothetical protein
LGTGLISLSLSGIDHESSAANYARLRVRKLLLFLGVQGDMLIAGHYRQILNAIVQGVMIQVMHFFMGQ